MLNHARLLLRIGKKRGGGRSGWAAVIIEGFLEEVREKLSFEIKTSFG